MGTPIPKSQASEKTRLYPADRALNIDTMSPNASVFVKLGSQLRNLDRLHVGLCDESTRGVMRSSNCPLRFAAPNPKPRLTLST